MSILATGQEPNLENILAHPGKAFTTPLACAVLPHPWHTCANTLTWPFPEPQAPNHNFCNLVPWPDADVCVSWMRSGKYSDNLAGWLLHQPSCQSVPGLHMHSRPLNKFWCKDFATAHPPSVSNYSNLSNQQGAIVMQRANTGPLEADSVTKALPISLQHLRLRAEW